MTGEIMLKSLEIRNYRNLKHLKIDKLGRVNLIVGKNNTGKTSVLEAVSIWALEGKFDWIFKLLQKRKEYFEIEELTPYEQFKNLSNIFFQRKVLFSQDDAIQIVAPLSTLSLRFVRYIDANSFENLADAPQGLPEVFGKIYSYKKEVGTDIQGAKLGLECKINEKIKFRPFTRENISEFLADSEAEFESLPKVLFVSASSMDEELVADLWRKTQLTDLEEEVVKGLRILDDNIERISFQRHEDTEYAICKVKGYTSPLPLRSMGDGINRILTIILAMVNCENGYLLIDEFENGLHYSVQEKLWEIIFHLAERLNVQVFATTHSYDCIDAFSEVLNGGKYAKDSGVMIRLDNFKDTIEATVYDANEIQNTTRLHVDPR